MLLFDAPENHGMVGIIYLNEFLSKDEMTNNILINLKNGIKVDDILINHIEYCKENKIFDSSPYLLQAIINNQNENTYTRKSS